MKEKKRKSMDEKGAFSLFIISINFERGECFEK